MVFSGDDVSEDQDFALGIHASLLANINHAMRTPLNGLLGMSELLIKTGLDEGQFKYATMMRESASALLNQLENIMLLTMYDSGAVSVEPRSCCIKGLVKDALLPLMPAAIEKGMSLSLSVEDSLPDIVVVDADKLSRVITCLVDCSIKFADRGKISLNITRGTFGKEGEEKDCICFAIENSLGLRDAVKDSLEQYSDASKVADLMEFGSVTIDILTVRRLLFMMGSRIRFDKQSDHEPPFYFDLELLSASDEEGPYCSREKLYKYVEAKRALVFQKDILENSMLVQAMRLWDMDVQLISDHNEILNEIDAAKKAGNPYDILFLCGDIISGSQLVNIKKKVEKVVLAVCGASASSAFENEFSAVLRPPVYPEELINIFKSFYVDGKDKVPANFSDSSGDDELGAKILVVEDDLVSRMFASEFLERMGCRVSVAENGQHAISKLRISSGYDMIFMDCMMPRMDGFTATRKIRDAGFSDIPIVAMTANTTKEDREKSLAAGMDDYLSKPVNKAELRAMVLKHAKK